MHTPATETADGREYVAVPRYEVYDLSPPEQAIWRRMGFPVPADVEAVWARRNFTGGDVGPCRRRVRTAKEVAGEARRHANRKASREWSRRKTAEKKRRAAA